MQKHSLKVEKREVLGKKIKKLRRDGILPANIYGKDIKSASIQVPYSDFNKVFKEAGETGVVDVTLGGTAIPTLIHNIHKDSFGNVLHADFFKVNLKEKVKATIPLNFVGEPKAVTDKIGLLMPIHSEVEIEALPTELPESFEVNVENLAEIDQQLTVGDIKTPEGVTILTDPIQVIVKIGELVSKEAEEQAAEEAAAAEAAATTEGAEGETTEAAAEGAETKAEAPQGEESGEKKAQEEPTKEE